MKGRKRIGIWIIAAAVVLLVTYGFMPKPVLVSSAEVVSGPMQVTLEEEGRTRVRERYSVTAPVAGYVRRLPFEVGDGVSKGQTMVVLESLPSETLDPRQLAMARARESAARAALQATSESIEAAIADSSLAAAEYVRVEGLFASRSATQQMLDQARATKQRALSQLRSVRFTREVAEYEYEAARSALAYSGAHGSHGSAEQVAVVAPISGCILTVYQKDEGIVRAGQPLVDIGNADVLEVIVDVLSEDAVSLGPGTRVILERWGGEYPLKGIVRLVEPVGFTKISALGVEEQRVLVRIDFTSQSMDTVRLGDGYRLQARFILWEEEDVLQIPGSALFREGAGWSVFVVEDGRAVRQAIVVGQRSGLVVQVLTALTAGDRVITHPDDTVEDGVRVELR